MAHCEGTVSGKKVIRGFLWFFFVWFILTFINDWMILKGIGRFPIVDALTSFTVDPSAEDTENAVAMLIHAGLAVGILYHLLRNKKN